jgi:hypothetical protein
MTASQFRFALDRLGLSQLGAARRQGSLTHCLRSQSQVNLAAVGSPGSGGDGCSATIETGTSNWEGGQGGGGVGAPRDSQ